MKKDPIILHAEGLSKAFISPKKVQVLSDISLSITSGDSVAIMGRSGEGKSTLLHILGTLEVPDSGALTIAGMQVSPTNTTLIRNKKLGFIFQSFHLLEHTSAIDNVLMPARIARRNCAKGGAAYQRARELLDEVGLANRAHFDTRLLSGGEKQRLAIARALINDPDILLADEPTGNLDHHTSQQIQELLLTFTQKFNKSLIVVTHDQELANRCCYRFLLSEGVLYSA